MRDETLLGTYAEDQFKKNLENLIKTECFKSSTKEDINEHWDVGVKLTFDVKGLRKVNRKDNTTDENIHWVELKNTMGNKGWLYGDATHFAFETDDYWIVVEKFKLQEFIKNKCKDKIKCEKPTLYQLYSRKYRKDIITLVKTIDLIVINDFIVKL